VTLFLQQGVSERPDLAKVVSFQASELIFDAIVSEIYSSGSVLLSGTQGLITENAGLTFNKSVLSTIGLKVERLESDIDLNSNTIR
jgi:hypothetical protein